jgi:hypothetical protein
LVVVRCRRLLYHPAVGMGGLRSGAFVLGEVKWVKYPAFISWLIMVSCVTWAGIQPSRVMDVALTIGTESRPTATGMFGMKSKSVALPAMRLIATLAGPRV